MAYLLANQSYKSNQAHDDLWTIIDRAIEEDTLNNLVIVVPTSKLVRHYKSQIIRKYSELHSKPISELNIFSFLKFVSHCFKSLLVNQEIKMLSEAYSLAIFEETIKDCDLSYFPAKEISPTLLKRLFSIITGLREDGISSSSLIEEISKEQLNEDIESDLVKMNDINLIMSAYEQALGNKYLDASGTLIRLNKELSDSDKYNLNLLFPTANTIIFNDFTDFKKPEAELLKTLSESRFDVALHIDFSSASGPLLGGYETTILNLHQQGYDIIELQNAQETADTPTTFLRKHLFKHRGFKDKTDQFNDILRIVSTNNRLEEVKFIGKLVKDLTLHHGIAPSDICICSRQPENYADLFREIFYQYNIPTNVTNRISLNSSSLVISIFALFDIYLKKFRRVDIARAFASDYLNGGLFKNKKQNEVSILDAESLETNMSEAHFNIDYQNLFYVANRLRISGGINNYGVKQWDYSLANGINNCLNKIKVYEDEIANHNEDVQPELNNQKQELVKIEKAKSDFDIVKQLINFPSKLTADGFSALVKGILNKFKVYDALIAKYDSVSSNFRNQTETENLIIFENIEKESRAFYAFLQVLDEFAYILKDRYQDKLFTLQELITHLKTAIDGKKYQIREKTNYGVTVTSIEQTRGIPYKVTILCGMLDNEFPLRYRPEVFLGKEIPETEIKHNINEKLQFYQFLTNNQNALNAGDKYIFLTYPEYEEKNKLVRSPFIDYLLNITDLEAAGKVFQFNTSTKEYGDELLNRIANISASNIEISETILTNNSIEDNPEISDLLLSIEQTQANNKYFNYLSPEYSPAISEGIDATHLPINSLKYLTNLQNKVYSVTEFDSYSSCSIKYLYERILRLKIDEELELSLSPLELGNLIHRILYLFYKEQRTIQYNQDVLLKSNNPDPQQAQAKDIFLVKLDKAHRSAYLESLICIAKTEIDQIKYSHPLFNLDLEAIIGDGTRKGLLEIWLDEELNKRTDKGAWNFQPALFEIEFGEQHKANSRKYIQFENGLKVSGKIDRLEFYKSLNNIQFMVADYKSNAAPHASVSKIMQLKKFQIPIYLKAAQKYIETNYNIPSDMLIEPAGGVYYSYKNSRKAKDNKSNYAKLVLQPDTTKWDKSNFENITDFLEQASHAAYTITKRIADGSFELTDDKAACRYCDYGTICRIKDYKPNLQSSEVSEEE